MALRLPAEYYREVPLYAENLLSFAAGDGTPLAGVLNRLGGVKTIYMQEQDLRERAIACMNLLIHGAGGAGFATSSAHPLRNDWDLFNPNETVGKTLCDVVVAFPHFTETWDSTKYGYLDNRFKRYCPDGMPAQASPELGFLLHGLYFLKPEGTMVMGGVGAMLSRSSIAEKGIRQKLVEYGNLDSVILLPRDTFQHITGMPAALITAETDCPPHDVLFVDARDVTDEILGEPVNDAILNACKYHIETPGFARLVSPAEIRRNDCDLSPDRYIDARMMERTAEPDECCDGPSL